MAVPAPFAPRTGDSQIWYTLNADKGWMAEISAFGILAEVDLDVACSRWNPGRKYFWRFSHKNSP